MIPAPPMAPFEIGAGMIPAPASDDPMRAQG